MPGRAQRRPVWLFGCSVPHPLLAAPAPGRFRGGSRAGARLLRDLTRRGCPNGAATQRSEFHGAPRNRPGAGLPLRFAKGSQTEGRLSFGYFSLAKQRTSTSPAGATPGLRPQHGHAFNPARPGFDKLSPNGERRWRPGFDRLSPNGEERWRPGFDKLSPNGEGRWRPGFDKLSPNGRVGQLSAGRPGQRQSPSDCPSCANGNACLTRITVQCASRATRIGTVAMNRWVCSPCVAAPRIIMLTWLLAA